MSLPIKFFIKFYPIFVINMWSMFNSFLKILLSLNISILTIEGVQLLILENNFSILLSAYSLTLLLNPSIFKIFSIFTLIITVFIFLLILNFLTFCIKYLKNIDLILNIFIKRNFEIFSVLVDNSKKADSFAIYE